MNEQDNQKSSGGMSRLGLAALLAAVIAAAGAIGYRALSEAESEAPAQLAAEGPPTIESLKASAEADPDNPGAWQELGFAYYETEQFGDAVKAYDRAIALDSENAVLWSAKGEARLMMSQTLEMPADAVEAFRKALELDPTDARGRYYMAVRKDLAGDHQGAIDDWAALLKDTPPGAPWEDNVRLTIEQVGKINKIDVSDEIARAEEGRPKAPQLTAGNAIPGPSKEQIAAASAIAPGEQRNMAEGMVESLDAKLRANPANPDGWVMLMRSRMTLGQPEKAKQALADAVAGNPDQAERLRREAAALGVPE